MKKSIRTFLITGMCLSLLGCNNQNVTNETSIEPNQETLHTESNKMDKNIFYPSETTEKEMFYLNAANTTHYSPFEVSFDENYSKLNCKLYQLDNRSWKTLQEFDFELSGDTFWFLVTNDLVDASVVYKNVNAEEDSFILIGGRPFETVEPSFELYDVLSHFAVTDKVKVEAGVEFPVVANIYGKVEGENYTKSLIANTEDFYNLNEVGLHENEAYYMLTFTFFK